MGRKRRKNLHPSFSVFSALLQVLSTETKPILGCVALPLTPTVQAGAEEPMDELILAKSLPSSDLCPPLTQWQPRSPT